MPAGGTEDPGPAHGWPRPPEAPHPRRRGLAVRSPAPWRCASGLQAGALCFGLACCFSGTPSPRYSLRPRLRLRVSGGPGAVSPRAQRAVHLRWLVWTFRVLETASFQEDFRWLGAPSWVHGGFKWLGALSGVHGGFRWLSARRGCMGCLEVPKPLACSWLKPL